VEKVELFKWGSGSEEAENSFQKFWDFSPLLPSYFSGDELGWGLSWAGA
jgi:hypothetical protein